MESPTKFSYLRHLPNKNQCVFTFDLNVEIQNLYINEEINAVRTIDDTVGSLLQHITNKIQNIIKKRLNLEEYNGPNIEISLINIDNKKSVKGKRILKTFFNNLNRPDLEFHIFDQIFLVLFNPPLVKELQLPTVIYAGYFLQPRKFYCLYTDNKESKFCWYKSHNKIDWIELSHDYRYKVKPEDIGYYMKFTCIPYKNGISGPSAEMISDEVVEKMGEIPEGPFVQRQEFTKTKLNGKKFRVVSYNVLSNRYAEIDHQYNYCPPRALAIDYRKQMIGKELLGYNADIMCLQEVDAGPFTNYYKSLFQEQGYSCYYHKKGNRIPEGLACIFNKGRYKKIDDHQLVYSDEIQHNKYFSYLWRIIKSIDDVRDYFLRQSTSLHVTVLKERNDDNNSKKNNIIVIGNTHLFYHPDAEHIRLIQINMATTHLNFVKRKYSNDNNNVHVILCGDFNCSPRSNVFNYIINGKIDNQLDVLKKISDKINLYHIFKFQSACGTPKYTNYTKEFKDCLDYIFVEKNNINVVNIVPFPKDEDLAIYEGLPNTLYPSDHLALIVDLEFV